LRDACVEVINKSQMAPCWFNVGIEAPFSTGTGIFAKFSALSVLIVLETSYAPKDATTRGVACI